MSAVSSSFHRVVLYVQEDHAATGWLAAGLSSQWEVQTVASPAAVLAQCQAQRPAAVVLAAAADSMVALCQQVRARFPGEPLALLALLALDTLDVTALLAAGADDVVMETAAAPALVQHRLRLLLRLYAERHELNRYKSLAHNSADAMIFADADGQHITGWNNAATRIYGWSADEALGQPAHDFLDTRHVQTSREVIAQALTTRYFWRGEALQRHKSGRDIAILMSVVAVTDAAGHITEYIGINRDITPQKQLEETLRQSEQQMRSILEELLGRYITEVLPADTALYLMQQLKRMVSTGRPVPVEYELLIGERRCWFGGTLSPLAGEQALLVVNDITDQHHTSAILKETAGRYQQLFEYANDSILLIDVESGMIMDANRQTSRSLGYHHADLLRMNISDIEIRSSPEDTDSPAASLNSTGRLIIEQLYRHRNGSEVPVETSSRLISLNDRATILTFARDISERKLARDAEQEQRRLAEALRDTAMALSTTLEQEALMEIILENLTRLVAMDGASIMLLDEGIVRVIKVRGYSEKVAQSLRNHHFVLQELRTLHWMYEQRQPLLIPNTARDERWRTDFDGVLAGSYLAMPIILDGVVIGFINLDSQQAYHFKPQHVPRLEAFAGQVAIAIQNVRLYQGSLRHASNLEELVRQRTALLSDSNQQLKEQIIERRHIEDALQSERNLLRTLIDHLPDQIYVKDREHRFVLLNKATARALGVEKPEEAIGHRHGDYAAPEVAAAYLTAEQQILEQESPLLNVNQRFTDAGGNELWHLISRLPLRDRSGSLSGIIGVHRDVTDMKQAEVQLQQILTSARCLLWFAVVEEHGQDFVWRSYVANEEAAHKLLPLALEGRSYTEAWEDSILPEDSERRRYTFRTHLRFNRMNYTQEMRCRLADGSLRWLTEEVQIRQLTPGRWSMVGVCTDITERKQAEETLRRAKDDLEQRVEARTHELVQANASLRQEIWERKRAEEAERHQRILAEALRDSAAAVNNSLDRDQVLDYILGAMTMVVPHDAANIMLLQDQEASIVRQRGYGTPITRLMLNIEPLPAFQEVLRTRLPFIVPDTRRFKDWNSLSGFEWVRSNITIPIRLEEAVIGFLNLDSAEPYQFNDEHARWLQAFADQASIAIRNARMVTEIRRQKDALEQRVEERTAELQYERAQLRAILDAMRDGVVYYDLENRPQYFNRAMTDITSYSATDVMRYQADEFIHVLSGEDGVAFLEQVDHSLAAQGIWNRDVEMHRPDNSAFDAALTFTEVKAPEGRRVGIVAVVRDVSQAKQLEQQKKRFIADAAHELRTPIANIKVRLHLLRRQPARFEENLDIAQKATDWMQRLVDNLFDLSRFERGVIELKRELVILQQFLRDVITRFHEPEAERLGIDFRYQLPEQPILLQIDPYRMTQVITNLVGNALNYMGRAGTVTLAVVVDAEAQQAVIRVIDTGSGIAPEHLPFLFQPFYRARNDDRRGTGLGLTISDDIVRLHRGTLSVESQPGVGSTFIVRLPLTDTSEPALP
ncbi:MAG: PAS domain S-box protein [Anaerolineae bacterium]|nr:PAS domain S-box protein [Anaerolineae bacterium]